MQRCSRKHFLAVLLLLIAGVAALRMLARKERVHQGQTVSKWVRQLPITPLGQTNPVLDVLLDLGPDCLPPLITDLADTDNLFTRAWQRMWPKLPLRLRMILPMPVPRKQRRTTAAWALGQIGPAARP